MKRVFWVLIITLFLTGCDINYTLNVDDSFSENVTAIETNSSNWSYSVSGMTMMEYNDYFLQKEIPYHYNDSYVPENFVRFDNVSYYDVGDLSDNKKIGIGLSSKFDSVDGFSRSNLIWKTCANKSIIKNDDGISIKISGFKVFDEYKTLDKLTVNIKSKYSFLSNNADDIKNNVYSWAITRDNYDKKSIDVVLKTSNLIEDVAIQTKDNIMIKFAFALMVLVVIFFVIYKFVMGKYKRNNSF